MSSEISWAPIDDLVEDIIDRRGVTPLKLGGDFVPSGHRVISAKLMKGNRLDLAADEPRFVSSEIYAKWMKSPLMPGDVLMTSEAPLGELAFIAEECNWVLGQRLFALRPDPKLLDGRFLYYALHHPTVRADIQSRASGTTVQGIRQTELRKVQLPLLPISEQQEVAAVLAGLDDRIDNLRATNATLEAIAQAIFKSWFIDFDPVRAKMEGREPEGMDAETAALFPSEFEESELGLIPRGWRVQPIGELTEIVGGSTPDTKNEDYWAPGVFHWTSPKDLSGATAPVLIDTERLVSEAGLTKISSGLLPPETLLLSSRAPIGYLSLSKIPVAINQGYIAMLPGGTLPTVYLYFWTQANMEVIKDRSNGSTFMEISKKMFRPIPALVPPLAVAGRFAGVAEGFFDRITANQRQAHHLSDLRDLLLPRLISGKISIGAAGAALEAA